MITLWIFVPVVVCRIFICLTCSCCAERQTQPHEFSCTKKREAFERWHDHQIEQLGTASNTLFALASAAFGYSLTLLGDSNSSLVRNHTVCFLLFTSAFAVSLILGLLSIAIVINLQKNLDRQGFSLAFCKLCQPNALSPFVPPPVSFHVPV
jgi:hypothetical protein